MERRTSKFVGKQVGYNESILSLTSYHLIKLSAHPHPIKKKTPPQLQQSQSKKKHQASSFYLYNSLPSSPSPLLNPLSSHAQPTHRAGSTDKCSFILNPQSPLNHMLWILMICVISSNVSFSDLICNAECQYAITLVWSHQPAQSIDPSTQHSKAKATQRYHPNKETVTIIKNRTNEQFFAVSPRFDVI